MPLLEVRDLSVRFGGVVALDRVSFSVDAGEVVALIGPNGAGKTTLFNVITRVYKPSGGTVFVEGQSVLTIAPHQVIHRGLARTFQNVALFRSMSVLENVLVGGHIRTRSGWLQASLPMPGAIKAEAEARDRAMAVLTDSERAAILQCYYHDLSHDEAAYVLRIPIGTVKTHILKAKEKLRLALSDYDDARFEREASKGNSAWNRK